MRADDIGAQSFAVMFRNLCLAYGKHVPAVERDALVEVYYGQVRGFAHDTVDRAIGDFIANPSQYFPKAGHLRGKCRELEGQVRPGGETNPSDTCPWCHRDFWVAGYECGNGQVVGRRRCGCQQAGKGWETEAARDFEEKGVTRPGGPPFSPLPKKAA